MSTASMVRKSGFRFSDQTMLEMKESRDSDSS
ncbi:hypothetical protein ES703_17610 [subsurface metagenome]